tara:strand:+ start:189 stop:434 length:246 start_codon:yes stop_codon:yes gene_type:complete
MKLNKSGVDKMTDVAFWESIDDRIMELIQLIRLAHPKFTGTPIEKVVVKLYDAYRASGLVSDAIDKGWILEVQRCTSPGKE